MSAAFAPLVDFFKSQSTARVFKKGQVIISQGDPPRSVYMIKSGIVKMYTIDRSGEERTITIFALNHVFPVIWLLTNRPTAHLYYYEAFTDTVCYAAPMEEAEKYIRQHPDLLFGIVDALTRIYENQLARVQNLERSHIHERLEFVLYFIASMVGEIEGDVARINTQITQADIARLAGVTRESMSTELNRVKKLRLIWKEGQSTYIDLGKLRREDMPIVFP